jgi:hypothetical protein
VTIQMEEDATQPVQESMRTILAQEETQRLPQFVNVTLDGTGMVSFATLHVETQG